MDKKIIGSIFFLIGIFLAAVSIQSFFYHFSNLYSPMNSQMKSQITNSGIDDGEITSGWEPIIFVNNQSITPPVPSPVHHVEKSALKGNEVPISNELSISILDILCAIVNLISALISGYVARTGYKMMCLEESRKEAMLREQRSYKDAQDSKN